MWYMVAEVNYGERVTDPSDRILINVLFKNICNSNLHGNNYLFSDLEDYSLSSEMEYDEMFKYVSSNIPSENKPVIFGMHSNADIKLAINETNGLFSNTLLTLTIQSSSKDGLPTEDHVKDSAIKIKKKLPKKSI